MDVRGYVNVSVRQVGPADTGEIDPGNAPQGAAIGGAALRIGPLPTGGSSQPLGGSFHWIVLIAVPVLVAVLVWRWRRTKPRPPTAP